jgi:hypothetical protein
MGLAGIHPGPNLSKRQQEHAIYPYLLRGVTASAPNHVWGIDITYMRLAHGWLYLVAVLDWYSRYVVSWELDQTLHIGFVLTAARRALGQHALRIWNSEQGQSGTVVEVGIVVIVSIPERRLRRKLVAGFLHQCLVVSFDSEVVYSPGPTEALYGNLARGKGTRVPDRLGQRRQQ